MDLKTNYLGINLRNPIVPSASPLSYELDNIRMMEDMGAGAVVMYSLFEEQIKNESHELDHYLSYGSESFGEALSYFPEMEDYNTGPDEYLEHIRKAKEAVDIPIFGSLNGVSSGGWIEYAEKIEDAGADGMELNIYYIPTNPQFSGTDVEKMYIEIVKDVKKSVKIPVAVKLNPFFSSLANMALKFAEAGADGLVLFNRFYQPDLDIENLEVEPHLVLSRSFDLRLPLRWVAILYDQVNIDLAISSGVHTYKESLKGLMAGAKITMLASELLANGIERISDILTAMTDWMEEHDYHSVKQMQGSLSQVNVAEPAAFERANYMKVLQSWRPDPTGQLRH